MNKSESKNIIYVTTEKNKGKGSLRNAIDKANESINKITKIIIEPIVKNISLASEIVIESNIELIIKEHKLTINSNYKSRIFHITSKSNYFKIKSKCNASLENASSTDNGGAIYIESADHTLILENVVLTNNIANAAGGAIYTMGNIILISSNIQSNYANTLGGGIYSAGDIVLYKSNVIKNKVLVSNESYGGGGIFIDNGNCILHESNVNYNTVAYDLTAKTGGSGGGIIVMNGSIYVQNNSHVDYNIAYDSAGIQQGIGNVNITNNSSASYNKSFNTVQGSAGGGGVTITLGTVIVNDSEICNNETLGMYSGGIVSLVGDVIINNSKICNNSNRGPGGGVALNVGSVTISNSQICNNIGASLGGAVVCFTPGKNYVTVYNSHISNNTLTNAETIKQTIEAFLNVINNNMTSNSKQATLSGGKGGAIFIQNIPNIIQQITNVSNQMKELNIDRNIIGGGAIACLLSTYIIVNNSFIENNFAGRNVSDLNSPFEAFGGGVFGFKAKIYIQKSIIKKNKTTNKGGAIFSKSELNVADTKITKNIAKTNGGGIINDINAKAIFINTIIENNSAEKGAGIFNKGTLEFINTKITNNEAKDIGGGIYSNKLFSKSGVEVTNNSPDNIVIL